MFLHLYAGEDGESHFKDLDVVPKDPTTGGTPQQTAGMTFTRRAGGEDGRWLPGAQRHFVFFFGGQSEIGASDGTIKVFGAGDILLLDDHGSKGHSSRVLAGADRISVQIQSPL